MSKIIGNTVGTAISPRKLSEKLSAIGPNNIDLSRLGPDDEGKGYIVETYPDGYTQETELTYEDGKITKIKVGDTVTDLEW